MTDESRANLWLAMVETVGRQFPATGYIHRKALEVVMLQADALQGGVGLPADELRVASAPDQWLRIPRYDGAARARYGNLSVETLAAFAQDFFDAHDLPIFVRPPEARVSEIWPEQSSGPPAPHAGQG